MGIGVALSDADAHTLKCALEDRRTVAGLCKVLLRRQLPGLLLREARVEVDVRGAIAVRVTSAIHAGEHRGVVGAWCERVSRLAIDWGTGQGDRLRAGSDVSGDRPCSLRAALSASSTDRSTLERVAGRGA
jgi:hypothetical protein